MSDIDKAFDEWHKEEVYAKCHPEDQFSTERAFKAGAAWQKEQTIKEFIFYNHYSGQYEVTSEGQKILRNKALREGKG